MLDVPDYERTDPEYYATVEQLLGKHEGWGPWIQSIVAGEVPDEFPGSGGTEHYNKMFAATAFDSMTWRYAWTAQEITRQRHGMWGIVDRRWTKQLAEQLEGQRVLEVMAGRGWLAKALTEHGLDVLATDSYAWLDLGKHHGRPVTEVQLRSAEQAITDLGSEYDVLLVSWPPYAENDAYQAIRAWGPEKPIVYIGEGYMGCTADDEFHNHFRGERLSIDYPIWPTLHDDVWIGHYTPEAKKRDY